MSISGFDLRLRIRTASERSTMFDRQIAHAFQIRIDLDGRDEKPHVARHGLLAGEQAGREVVDFNLDLIDPCLVA